MKRVLSLFVTSMIAFGSLGMLYSQTAYGEPGTSEETQSSNKINRKAYNLLTTWSKEGVSGSCKLGFEVKDNWSLKSGVIDIYYDKSSLLDQDVSSVTTYVNGVPIDSFLLEADGPGTKNKKISIPIENINKGYNQIEFKTYTRISDDLCKDNDNSGNWVKIKGNTGVILDYEENSSELKFSDFPAGITNGNGIDLLGGTILIPSEPESHEITTALMISARYGIENVFGNISMKVLKMPEFNDYDKSSFTYIGKLKGLPKELEAQITSDEKSKLKDNVVLKKIKSPYNAEKHIVLVLSENGELLKKAGKFLLSSKLVAQLEGNSYIIDKDTDIEDVLDVPGEKITFESMGYGDTKIEGLSVQASTYSIDIPKDRNLSKDGKVVIKYGYAQNADPERSLMTVYLNDIPIGSKRLSAGSFEEDELEISIPSSIRENAMDYSVKVEFKLAIKDIYCTAAETELPWGFVSKESYLQASYKNGRDLLLEMYPNPFIEEDGLDDISIVVPDNMKSSEISQLANLTAHIGKSIKSNRGELKILKSSDLTEKDKKSNLIVYGDPDKNEIIKDLNQDLYIKYDDSYKKFQSNDKVNMLDESASSVATVQLIESPFDKDKGMLIVTGKDEVSLEAAIRNLCGEGEGGEVKGNAMIVDKNGYIKSYYFGEFEEKEKDENSSFIEGVSGSARNIVIFLAISMVIAATTGVLYARKYKR